MARSDWQLGEELGRGAFASVFCARRADGVEAALKIANAGDQLAAIQLRAEAEALRAIGAPTVPALIEDGASSAEPFLALERVHAQTLAEILRSGPLSLPQTCTLGLRLLDALVQVHARGFLALDLNPRNVFASREPPQIRLFDFGLAQPISPRKTEPVKHLARAGTAGYQAPEQIAGDPLDPRTDVYSAGAVLFEMLAGRPPFSGASGEVQQAHLSVRVPRPSRVASLDLPVGLEEVILRSLAKEKEARFASAEEMRAAWLLAMDTIGLASSKRLGVETAAAKPLQRRSAGLIYFAAAADALKVQAEVERAGAILGSAAPPRYVALVAHERSDHPVRDALSVAQTLCSRGLTERAVVDVAQVAVQTRGRSPARFLSSAFENTARFVDDRAPIGPLLSEAASLLLPEVRVVSVSGVEELRRPLLNASPSGPTLTALVERSPLIGREEILAALVGSARKALSDAQPAITVICADAGLGKSHLSSALREDLSVAVPDAELLELRTPEPVASGPGGLLHLLISQLIDGRLREKHGDRGTREKEVRARVELLLRNPRLARELFPAVALALGLYAHDAPELRALAAAPGALRSLALRAVGELLRAQSLQRPLCLIIDDGHLADDTALDGLEYAALAEAQVPLWICVLARPSFASARKSFGERAAASQQIELKPLDARASEELCRALLLPAANIPAAAIERLVQRTQGVPLLLTELIRGLKRDGLLKPSGSQSWVLETNQLDHLPDLPLVEWLAARELDALPPDLAAHARLVALLGVEVVPSEVEGVIAELERSGAGDALPLDARVAMRRLRSAGLLTAGAGETLRMRHNLVRDAIARTSPEELKAAVHDAAFRFYSDRASAPEVRRLPLLALHAAASGRKGPAAALYLELGSRAIARHAYLEAERECTRALELLEKEDAGKRLEALHARASMRYRIGRGDDALADFAAARALAQQLGAKGTLIELMLEEATALDWQNDFASSSLLVTQAEKLAASVDLSQTQRARLALGAGRRLFRQGHWERAAVQLEQASTLAETCGDAGYETRVIALLLLQVVLPQLGRVEDCERLSEQVIALSRERGDQLHLGSAINNRRNLLVARKALGECVADQLAFMRIGRELGMVISEYLGEFNLGELLFQSGDEARAGPHIERALAIEARHPEVAPRPFATLLKARYLAAQGKSAEALSELALIRGAAERAQQENRASGVPNAAEEVLADLVELACGASTPAKWAELVARSQLSSIEQEHLEVLELCARTALREGRIAAAQESLAAAREAAVRIPNLYGARLARLEAELDKAPRR